MRLFNVAFASVIAFGVVYNAARIALAERGRELAMLRVMGFSRAEISLILLGELAAVTLAAIPAGLVLGRGLAGLVIRLAYDTELFRIPPVVGRSTYAFAAAVTLGAALVSGLAVPRLLDRLDLVAVLKSKGVGAMKPSRQNLLLVGLGLCVVGLLVWAFLPAPVEVDLGGVERGPMLVTVEHEGKTRVRERYVVSSPLAGRLLRVGLRPGDPVEAGRTLLAVIEPADPALLDVRARAQAEARVEQASSARKQAASNLERARAARDQAVKDLQRARRMRPGGSLSEQEYDFILYRGQTAAAEVRAGEFALRVAEFELEQARAALIHSRPRSPGEPEPFRFDVPSPVTGVVLRVFQESATVVAPGERLLEVGDSADLECEIDVLSSDAVKVRPGQRALLEHWGGDGPLEGRVRVREPSAFMKVSALGVEEQRVNVIIDLTEPPHRRPTLGDGYRVEARIVVWEGRDMLKVPSGALFRRGEDWAVFAAERGRAALRAVRVGRNNGLRAEVLEGLAEGDEVILHPSDRVRPGLAVVPRPGR